MRTRLLAGLLAAAAPFTLLAAGPARAVETPVAMPVTTAANPEPSTTPAVSKTWVTVIDESKCPSGYLCAYVHTNVPGGRPGRWMFKFYACADYKLHYWHDYVGDASLVVDHQTGGVVTTLFGSSGNVLQTIRPATHYQDVPKTWNPVYTIRSC